MSDRYIVKDVPNMGGAVMYQVHDSLFGMSAGSPKYFQDEAQRTADRLNNRALADEFGGNG
jgi:hypothetical protein